jgi:hypothetical protein
MSLTKMNEGRPSENLINHTDHDNELNFEENVEESVLDFSKLYDVIWTYQISSTNLRQCPHLDLNF